MQLRIELIRSWTLGLFVSWSISYLPLFLVFVSLGSQLKPSVFSSPLSSMPSLIFLPQLSDTVQSSAQILCFSASFLISKCSKGRATPTAGFTTLDSPYVWGLGPACSFFLDISLKSSNIYILFSLAFFYVFSAGG